MKDILRSTDGTFEENRQEYETRNEIRINQIQFVHFAIVLLGNVATRFFPIAPYVASIPLLATLATSFAVRVYLFIYFRAKPAYSPARKYVIASFDLAIFTIVSFLFRYQDAYPPIFLSLFAVCVLSMLITLCALRYDQNVLIFTWLLSALIFVVVFPWQVEREYQAPVLGVGLGTLTFIAVVTVYASRSLVAMHREVVTKQQLSRFLAPEMISQVIQKPDLLNRTTELRRATIVFADVRGFTALSEKLPPGEVVDRLNEFLEETSASILKYQGMIDKYIGDAVLGVFGVPTNEDDHAHRAVLAAIEMCRRLDALNELASANNLPTISNGVGVHTGELLIGVIGSSMRFDYTVIGDTVNVASRIESLTRQYETRILCSDATKLELPKNLHLDFVGTVTVKNREQALGVWCPDQII